MKQIEFNNLSDTDLYRNSLCKGGALNNLSSEPISKILPVGNQSGIRFKGTIENLSLVVLYSTFNDLDWPDSLDGEILTYFGDNKSPGGKYTTRKAIRYLEPFLICFTLIGETIYRLYFFFKKGQMALIEFLRD